MNVQAALSSAERIGPFFRVRVVEPDGIDATATLARLYEGGPALETRLRTTAAALGVTDRRVAGSIFFQGLAARLWAPTLAVAVRERRVLRLPPEATTPEDSGLVCGCPALASGRRVHEGGSEPDDSRADESLASGALDAVIDTHLEPLAAVLEVPRNTLWGNAASAMIGSYEVMTAARAELSDADLVRSLLRGGRLADTGRLDADGRFRRNSCCLFYRVPGGGLCGDCVLHRRERSRPLPHR